MHMVFKDGKQQPTLQEITDKLNEKIERQGAFAFRAGLQPSACPHQTDSLQAKCWLRGYYLAVAKFEADENSKKSWLPLVCLTIFSWLVIAALVFGGIKAFGGEAQGFRIIDGDSFEWSGQKYRLYGIDAPEKNQPHGSQATRELLKLMLGKEIDVIVEDKDRYGREVVWMEYPSEKPFMSVQEGLVKAGAAWVSARYCKRPECASLSAAQQEAKRAKSGLWASDNPVAPWVWRRQ